jgi:hypothetical protein
MNGFEPNRNPFLRQKPLNITHRELAEMKNARG